MEDVNIYFFMFNLRYYLNNVVTTLIQTDKFIISIIPFLNINYCSLLQVLIKCITFNLYTE